MNNEFAKALICNRKNDRIPEEDNYFEALIGEWDFEWTDHYEAANPRRVIGE